MITHPIPNRLLTGPVSVFLVGCGGNGSQMLGGLARMDRALRAVGHPGGLRLTAWDPDLVSEANVGRQLFSPADIGCPKADVLIYRINAFYGTEWTARAEAYGGQPDDESYFPSACDLLITCVDSLRARRKIYRSITTKQRHGSMRTPGYWLDLGNTQDAGQVILGEPCDGINGRKGGELPHFFDLFPELLAKGAPEDNRPSCSLAEALETQDLFINQAVSTWALHLLWTLFRRGGIEHHGYFLNLTTGQVNPLPVPAARKGAGDP